MTNAPKPPVPISHAKAFAASHGLNGVIIVGFTKDGNIAGCSYDRTKAQCRTLAPINDSFVEQLAAGIWDMEAFE